MCGIIGGVIKSTERLASRIENSLHNLKHRGPDDRGYKVYNSKSSTIVFGHTRLAIIDLSESGHQPMESPCGRYSIVFNGEIYNYQELKKELCLHNIQFSSNSDTEVLLNAWVVWGESCIHKLNGMFSFVILDNKDNKIYCVRDPFGIKPFFYIFQNSEFYFASEQRQLIQFSEINPTADTQRCFDYLVHNDYDSRENTFIKEVKSLPPAHRLTLDLNNITSPKIQQWWKPEIKEDKNITFDEAAYKLRTMFLNNIKLHLRSDVPVGIALSGGIDSSAIACAVKYLNPEIKLNTFSFISSEEEISEELWIDEINKKIEANPHKIYAEKETNFDELFSLIRCQGEPFSTTSIYAQYRVFKRVKESGIKVTLEGQGADELLGGYSGFPAHRILSLIENKKYAEAMKFYYEWLQWPGRESKSPLLQLGKASLPKQLYHSEGIIARKLFIPSWIDQDYVTSSKMSFHKPRIELDSSNKKRRLSEELYNSIRYRSLPALLRHSDRNSMNFSVESRVPFLTKDLAEFCFSLPEQFHVSKQGETKSVFRDAMKGIVPEKILDRKDKMGFAANKKITFYSSVNDIEFWIEHLKTLDFIDSKKISQIVRDNSLSNLGQDVIWRWVNFSYWHYTNFKR
ncbi:asparagine synthase (glutamine-hydrolyzing) [Endozoicomonadaceae bacterium StTr2]